MKKILAIALALALVLCMGISANADETYTVGICQLLQHPALDAATKGFIDALNTLLPGQVEIQNKNASGEPTNCATIVNDFVSAEVDLILGNATPALSAAANATATIPVLGTAITAYPVALELGDDYEYTGVLGGNVSGTSDLADLDKQAAMFPVWFPEAKTVGIMYCTAEANSLFQFVEMNARLTEMGYEVKAYTFTDSNDITSVTEKACSEVDVIYIPTDNTAASNTEAIANVVLANKVPVIAGEEGICAGCGVATMSISYYDLGYTTGEMAAKILTGEAKIEEMAIGYAPVTAKYNAANCELLGLTVPEGYEAIAE